MPRAVVQLVMQFVVHFEAAFLDQLGIRDNRVVILEPDSCEAAADREEWDVVEDAAPMSIDEAKV